MSFFCNITFDRAKNIKVFDYKDPFSLSGNWFNYFTWGAFWNHPGQE